jgi:hypothetical protein
MRYVKCIRRRRPIRSGRIGADVSSAMPVYASIICSWIRNSPLVCGKPASIEPSGAKRMPAITRRRGSLSTERSRHAHVERRVSVPHQRFRDEPSLALDPALKKFARVVIAGRRKQQPIVAYDLLAPANDDISNIHCWCSSWASCVTCRGDIGAALEDRATSAPSDRCSSRTRRSMKTRSSGVRCVRRSFR